MTHDALLIYVRDWLANRQPRAAEVEQTAPEFSILEFLDTRENGLSRILAWLLNPRGSHAQGSRFLHAFLRWLSLGDDWFDGKRAVQVSTEVAASSAAGSGFIDVLIRSGGRALAIENKPWAADQPLQVERYLEHLSRWYLDGHILVYLSGSGVGPSIASIGKERAKIEIDRGALKIRGYDELIDWLEECRELCRAPIVEAMISGVTRYIKKEFFGVNNIASIEMLATDIFNSGHMLESALAIIEATPFLRGKILERLVAEVGEECSRRPGWHIIRSDLGPEAGNALLVGFAPGSNFCFGIQFENSDFRWLFYGVSSVNGAPMPDAVKISMERFFKMPQKATVLWPFWRTVNLDDNHFRLSQPTGRDFWVAAIDGSLRRMLVDYLSEIEIYLREEDIIGILMDDRLKYLPA
jgi:hypothetical protein